MIDLPWLPLAGIRVLDFTWMIAGPVSTRTLADFGAQVIKVESYNRVDRIRETGPHPDGPWSLNEDGSFNDVNLGKQSLLLNLNTPGGIRLAKELVSISDVVAANYTGSRMDRWGLGFDDLVRVRPDLIYLTMPVYESAGERQRWGGIGTHVGGLAGLNSVSGFPDEPPYGLGVIYPDFAGNPYHAMAAVSAALIERDRHGGPQLIELSQYESTVSILGPALLEYAAIGAVPGRPGNHSLRACPHNVYRCQGDDRWCAIEVFTEQEWHAFCTALDRSAWRDDPRFRSQATRRLYEGALDAAIEATTAEWQADVLAERLQAAGVGAAPVRNLADLMTDERYRREYYVEQQGPEGCVFTSMGEPIRPFGRQQPVTRAPMMGEHTEQLMGELLALSLDEISALYVEGVLA